MALYRHSPQGVVVCTVVLAVFSITRATIMPHEEGSVSNLRGGCFSSLCGRRAVAASSQWMDAFACPGHTHSPPPYNNYNDDGSSSASATTLSSGLGPVVRRLEGGDEAEKMT